MIEFTCDKCEDVKSDLVEALEDMIQSLEMTLDHFEEESPVARDVVRGYFAHEHNRAKKLLDDLKNKG